ncbi:hypothetical protein DBR43_30720 [Pedobacter sp. KBW06]|uniref:hypothetical protein n=1 Tax=Pedobacter sp. KBW06 TaxID=2153359 RepID=UPI000F59869D|nr:hypothetical protein [Pedobacter sp. KBW06]RQO65226.1 hypothetical protein DBR43_30720 [Pedobacter sp. KBW06]
MDIVLFYVLFFGIVLLILYLRNKNRDKNYALSADVLAGLDAIHLDHVKCETFSSGMKGKGYYFSRCELFITEDALVIFGLGRIKWLRQLSDPLILTSNSAGYVFKLPGAKLIKPKTINLNSFGGDIYIEFVQPGFIGTNVEFRLKGISTAHKERLQFLNTSS